MTMLSATVDVEVPFQDLDPMQVVWHGNYFRYFEAARSAMLRKIDYDYPQMDDSGFIWPLVDVRVKFVRPARYAQRLTVTAVLEEWENRMKISYRVCDAATGEVVTRGHSIQCAVDRDTGELQFVSPRALLDRLQGITAE